MQRLLFWHIIYCSAYPFIVWLQAKCELYLPEDNTTDCYENIKITVNHMSEADGYMIRDISIQVKYNL